MRELLDGLNSPQRRAVEHGSGPLLVLAGAGSGKTRVLTHRVAHLIAARGVRPERILAITFTNRAAGEMRERLGALIGPPARAIWAGTFHAACVRLLRREAEAAGYSREFVIYDADDQLRLLRTCFADEEVDTKRFAPRGVHAAISDAKNRLVGPEEFGRSTEGFGGEVVARLYARYQRRLRENQAMDFDDLLGVTVRLLEGDEAVRTRWQARFEHVLVDEYQDTNHAQFRLVRVLGEPQREVVVVGDDDQSIYSWRGADVGNILDFERDYPEATTIALEQNYRSTGTILRAANAVVARNRGRHRKELWSDLGDGDPIQVTGCRDEHDEARVVVEAVDRALAGGVALSDVAVFYRTNAQSRAIEDRLVRGGVAYDVIGGPRFYERAEIRDALSYLRAALNPDDSVSIGRMLGAPRRGIGPGCIARIRAHAEASGAPLGAALGDAADVPGLSTTQRETLAATADLLSRIARMAAAGAPLERIVDTAVEESGLRGVLIAEGTFEAQGRIENLDELVGVAGEYRGDATGEITLRGFLEEVALQADADTMADAGEGRLTLMTIHNAKGLEFDTVVITGLEEGLFPHQRSDTPEALEEERRLFYVGLTRARRRLVLTHADSRAMYGGRDYRMPSRFLGELPADALAEPPGARRGGRGFVTELPRSAPALSAGDAVLHATFGEGIVTDVERGGELVRVRFARDGAERRLMAGAAPMKRVEAG